jgi:DNA-binding response OmpR family regulator
VVDDEPLIADSLALILSDYGYNALAAYGGVDALNKAETFTPDLLFTDVVMPDLDGMGLAVQLSRRWPGCKVLFISGHVSASDLQDACEGIPCSFELVEKPIHPLELLERIRTLLLSQAKPSFDPVETTDVPRPTKT